MGLRLFSGLFPLIFLACATASQQGGEGGFEPVMHYRGTTTMTSTGGVEFAPPAELLLTREVLPDQNKIVETRRSRGQTEIVELLRKGEGATFTGESELTGWTGTFVFTGPEWAWNHWTIDLTMNDGSGKIEGIGSITPEKIAVERWFVTKDGVRRVKIVDQLTRISAEELRQLTSGEPPAPPRDE